MVQILWLTRRANAGAYHFGHPNTDAVAQANHFVSTVGTLQKGDFVVLDIEAADNMKPTACALSLAAIISCAALLRGCGPFRLWDDHGRIARQRILYKPCFWLYKTKSCHARLEESDYR